MVWSPSSRAATVRKLSTADIGEPPGLTVEIGFDHDFVIEFPEESVAVQNHYRFHSTAIFSKHGVDLAPRRRMIQGR